MCGIGLTITGARICTESSNLAQVDQDMADCEEDDDEGAARPRQPSPPSETQTGQAPTDTFDSVYDLPDQVCDAAREI